jgi:hypothetical protein
MNTDRLIERLAENLDSVEPLHRPGIRAAAWLLGAMLYVVILALPMTSVADLSAVGNDSWILLPQVIAIVTSMLAVNAALASVVPGHSKLVFVWPVLALLVWLATLVATSPQQTGAPAGIAVANREWLCVAQILLGGAPLVAMLAMMARRGAPLYPAVTAALVAIAVGTLANVGACVTHPHTDNRITLVWHGAAILALLLVCVAGGRFVLSWSAAKRTEGN